MKTWHAEVLSETKLLLGEGAYWHNEWGKFLFIDIKGKRVGAIDPTTKEINIRELNSIPGMVGHIGGTKLFIATQGKIEEMDFETGERQLLVEMEPEKPENRCNDGACDGMGRLWIGTMNVNAQAHEGALYCFDGSLKKAIDETSVSNGICWTKDHQTMYHTDSFEYNIKVYDFDLQNGHISNGRIAVEFTKGTGIMPDGMCIDEDGMLWVAIWGGGCVNRYNPLSGELTGKVTVAAPHVTSCAFGGSGLKQLLITTAIDGLTKDQLKQFPYSGSLFTVNLDVSGLLPNNLKK
ncbi:Sugar lactone lactonase YvrE [Mucilaginibacter pineti]|uniref:Sugar lactone lactonase YvrE n=1 Tax=Mucilaginibacter pineti TaxID=1391627 RepID=A0A1G7M0F7_9SPHI|nr:SMP-30/gluconolactonase/LRE family protein [Mucilaginibacter pineti]SDF55163.1 Sugar lactone lactonase YvrE [Mucilaginibacter pineti]